MAKEKSFAIDMFSLYLGVEHYYEYDEFGRSLEIKEIEAYCQNSYFSSERVSRRVFVNLNTTDLLYLDQYGNCNETDSETRDIIGVEHIKSFKDCVEKIVAYVDDSIDELDNVQKSYSYFKRLNDLMEKCERVGKPLYMDIDTICDLYDSMCDMYILSFGNPLTKQKNDHAILRFDNHRRKK